MSYKRFTHALFLLSFLSATLFFLRTEPIAKAQSMDEFVPLSPPTYLKSSIVTALSLYVPNFTPVTLPISLSVLPTSMISPTANVTPTISATPTPPITQTPTPIPQPQGFCLYVPIILYHHTEPYAQAQQEGHAQLTVDSVYFDQQMAYLKNAGYTSITIDQLANALTNKQQLPPKSIAITIDDGYIDNYVYAYPILKKYNLVGNFMIPPGLIETPDYMTWPQIREMNANGMGLYNHTWSHASLAGATKEKVIQEVASANQKLEEELGKKITSFTYPYGTFDNQAIQTLKELGFNIALTTIGGREQCDTNIMTLYRDHIGNAPMESYGL